MERRQGPGALIVAALLFGEVSEVTGYGSGSGYGYGSGYGDGSGFGYGDLSSAGAEVLE